MPAIDDFDDDDEDWNEANDEANDEPDASDSAPCPECGKPVDYMTDKCPACGYWILESDRQTMWPRTGKPRWIKFVAAIVLVAMTCAALLALF